MEAPCYNLSRMGLRVRSKPRKISRRAVLAGLGGALVAAGSAVAFVRTRGYEVSDERLASLSVLAPWQLVVVEHLARRIAAPDDPNDPSIPSADAVDVAGFVDRYCAGMHALMRRDLLRLLGFIEHVAPFGVKKATRFSKLPQADQDLVLAWMESNDQGLLRGAFAGIKSLVFMGYYRDPRTWKVMGYAGPFVKRPAGGWW